MTQEIHLALLILKSMIHSPVVLLRPKRAIQHLWRINMEKEQDLNPPEPRMGYNGYYFELEEENENG
jgi:hypothetical protein